MLLWLIALRTQVRSASSLIVLTSSFCDFQQQRTKLRKRVRGSNSLGWCVCLCAFLSVNESAVSESMTLSPLMKCRHPHFSFLLVVANTPATPSAPANSQESSTFMKQVSLVSLTLQNVISILLLRYVRTTPGPRFFNSTAVVNSEVQKTFLSILLVISEQRNVMGGLKLIYSQIICKPYDTFKTGIPSLLYTLQNNLLFVSISNLDAATFQVRGIRPDSRARLRGRQQEHRSPTLFSSLSGELPIEDLHNCSVDGLHPAFSITACPMVCSISSVSRHFSCATGEHDSHHSQAGCQCCLRFHLCDLRL